MNKDKDEKCEEILQSFFTDGNRVNMDVSFFVDDFGII